jgi:hypothetical protein
MKAYAHVDLRSTIGTGAYAILRDDALASATELLRARDRRQGIAKSHEAVQYDASLRFSSVGFTYYKWYAKLWLQEHLGGHSNYINDK